MHQFLWTELIEPVFTEEERAAYHEMACSFGKWSKIEPIGNTVNGRRMIHGMGSIELCIAVKTFLTDRGNAPLIIAIKDRFGTDYGYKRLVAYDEEGNEIIDIVRDEGIPELLETDQDVASVYLQPTTEMIDGEEVTITPVLNSFAGWTPIV